MTTFLILKRSNTEGDGWVTMGERDAASKGAAIRAHLDGAKEVQGEYVAVPARSWQPVVVKVETALKFS